MMLNPEILFEETTTSGRKISCNSMSDSWKMKAPKSRKKQSSAGCEKVRIFLIVFFDEHLIVQIKVKKKERRKNKILTVVKM